MWKIFVRPYVRIFFVTRREAYLVIQEKYTARYVDRGSDGIPAKSRGARTWIVRQYLHLLPRSVIYFEDFLSSCTPRAARRFLYALCVGRDWNIFLLTSEKRDVIYSPATFRFFRRWKKLGNNCVVSIYEFLKPSQTSSWEKVSSLNFTRKVKTSFNQGILIIFF